MFLCPSSSPLFFLEDHELAEDIVRENDDDVGDGFHEHIVEMQDVHEQQHPRPVQHAGRQTAQEEGHDFARDLLCARRFAVKHPFAVGDVGKGDCCEPGDDRACHGVEVQRMCQKPIDRHVDDGGEHAENGIGDELLVFDQ